MSRRLGSDNDIYRKRPVGLVRLQVIAICVLGIIAGNTSAQNPPPRRITLEQVKQQQLASPATNPLARLGQLSIEVAKQHRLGVEADYFPKIGATAANLHYSEFLGQVLAVQRPLLGTVTEVPVPLFSQNQTFAAVTLMQPITPLFQVYQAVKIARADERIAEAKAGVTVAKNVSGTQLEETYFKLLIAQRKLKSSEAKLSNIEDRPLYAATSIPELARVPQNPDPALVEIRKRSSVGAGGSERPDALVEPRHGLAG